MNLFARLTTLHVKYRDLLRYRPYIITTLVGMVFLAMSLVINYYAGSYATEKASNAVTDIILNNIRVYDVDFFFVQGSGIFWLFVALLTLHEPRRIPFTLKSIALFVIIRSVFISLTHIGPFPTQVALDPGSWIKGFSFAGDLFFSAHTGLPFLMALLYWEHPYLRYVFLACSILFGAVVLLGHLHYSIDVFSAFFITYAIYHMSLHFFRKDRELFKHGVLH